ncbi:MAG: YfiR family protein [Myxococcota bacterium]|nr:YfiR family protein [Myxococcota bacterium]
MGLLTRTSPRHRKPEALAVAALLGVLVAVTARAQVDEYQLKGAFLFNFAKFVSWPKGARDSIDVCVAASNGVRDRLLASLDGKKAKGLPLVVTRLDLESARSCEMIFLGGEDSVRLSSVQEAVAGGPVLLVGETPGFAEKGGMINFVPDGTKLRFEVNRREAEGAGLEISSHLLKLATVVD